MSDLIERIDRALAASYGTPEQREEKLLALLRDCRAELAGREGMIKPSWDDAPSWAQWLAQDECGVWFWYELKPHTHPQRKWVGPSLSVRTHSQGVRNRAAGAGSGKPNPNWKGTLEKRPPAPEGQDVEDSHAASQEGGE